MKRFLSRGKKSAISLVLLALFVFGFVSCEKRTPEWHSPESGKELSTLGKASKKSTKKRVSAQSGEALLVRGVVYNVRNWLVSDEKGERVEKSEAEKRAVIEVLVSARPDVIQLIEIGADSDLLEIQTRLSEQGVKLPFRAMVEGEDSTRHVAILSKFPLQQHSKPDEDSFLLSGMRHGLQRGILDVSVMIGEMELRWMGLHLKSKRAVEDYDQAKFREEEAKLVRQHLNAVLLKEPNTWLVLCGDWNDGPRSVVAKTLLNGAANLHRIPLQDASGQRWTHFWKHEEIYSCIDHIAVSSSLVPHCGKANSGLVDHENWEEASDHRALVIEFEF